MHIATFVEGIEQKLIALKAVVRERDWENARYFNHQFLGSAKSAGFYHFTFAFDQFKEAATQRDEAKCIEVIDMMERIGKRCSADRPFLDQEE